MQRRVWSGQNVAFTYTNGILAWIVLALASPSLKFLFIFENIKTYEFL